MKHLIAPQLLRQWILAGTAAATLTACGASSDADPASTEAVVTDGTTAGTTTSTTPTAAVNALATAYPGTLALSVFPDATASLRLLAAEADSFTEKVEVADKRLRGEGDCFAAGQIAEKTAAASSVTCYEFDSDMNPSTFADRPGKSWGTKDGTDANGQACMVTFAKAEVDEITHKVDRALAMVQGMICVGKKDAAAQGLEPQKPEVGGAAVNLLTAMNKGLPAGSPISFSTAEMSAIKNSNDTITYVTSIALVNPYGKTDSITLRHTPAATEGGEEAGILTFKREPLGTKTPGYQANDPNASDKKFDVMAISYKKSTGTDGKPKMVAELTRAAINEKYSPISDKGLINFSVIPANASNSDINAIKYVSYDLNPETGAGNLSYWMNPGGSLAESARGFLFNLTAGTDNLLSGCGISGATQDVSIRKAAVDSTISLAPVRYWHPRSGQNTSADKDTRYPTNEGNLVTEQCFSQNASTGKYAIDATKTTSTRGYDVKTGSATAVKAPARPPEPTLPPLSTTSK